MQEDYSYDNFLNYLDQVYLFAGSYSLSKELKKVTDKNSIQPGYLLVHGGFPGHVEIVMDVCLNNETGEKLILLAQGFTPAQEIEVLENENNSKLSPWYSIKEERIETPQFVFDYNEIYKFE